MYKTGLWKYSQHPNYFFEWILWVGYIFIGWQSSWSMAFTYSGYPLYLFNKNHRGSFRGKLKCGRNTNLHPTNQFFPGFPEKSKLKMSLNFFIDLAERGMVPDFLIRAGIRNLCRKRCNNAPPMTAKPTLLKNMSESDASPMAVPRKTNEHYEVPAEFYRYALGKILNTAVVTTIRHPFFK